MAMSTPVLEPAPAADLAINLPFTRQLLDEGILEDALRAIDRFLGARRHCKHE